MSEKAEALLQELSKAVLDWESVDDDVKERGWTVDNEQPWNEARARMVELAHKVHDKESILTSAVAIQEGTVSEAEDKAYELREPDEYTLLEAMADSLRRQGYQRVVNECGTVSYEYDGKEGSIYIDVIERDKEE